MSNLNIESYQKNVDSIENELLYSLSIKQYQLNKNHTTSTSITQFFRDINKLNFSDEEDNTTKGNKDSNPFNTPTKYKSKSRSKKKQNTFPSLLIKSESITNIQQVSSKDENTEKNEIKDEKKPLFVVTKENKLLEENVRPDDYREKIARHILNEYHFNNIRNITKGKFKKIPKDIPNKASRKKNKYFLAMTLKEFYETKELYEKNRGEKTFEHNLSIINELRKDCHKDFREKSYFDDILEMTFSDLVVQYLKSEEYKNYINTLNGNEKIYYLYFAEHFIEQYNK